MAETTLKPEDRSRLDGIVQQMIANGETEDYIQGVVNDFKQKYSGGADAPEDWKSQLGDFASHAWGMVTGAAHGIRHPYQTAVDAIDRSKQELRSAVEAGKKGDYEQALKHFATAAPIMGPAYMGALDEIDQGKYGAAIGDIVGFKGVGKALESAPKLVPAAKAVAGLTEVDPSIAMIRALGPSPSDSGFIERLPETLAQIKEHGGPVTSNEELIPAAQKAINAHKAALESNYLAPARSAGVMVNGDPVVAATQSAVSSVMQNEDPAAAAALVKQAQAAYQGKQFTVDQWRKFLKEKNAELDSFYDKSTGKQQASVTSSSNPAIVKAQRDAIADQLYNAVDPQNQGAGPREIQRRTGDIIDILDVAIRKRKAILGQKPVSPAEKGSRIATGLIDIPGKVITGNVEEAMGKLKGAGRGASDPLIERAFKATGPAKPMPQPPQANPQQPRLGAPTIKAGPVPDTSGPIPQPSPPNMGSTSTRQLPAASSGIGVSGTIVPDIMGQPVTQPTAPYGGGRTPQPPRIAAPQPGQPPLNILPTGPGAIGPTGTVPVHSTETPIPQVGERSGSMLDLLRENRDNPPLMQKFQPGPAPITETAPDESGTYSPLPAGPLDTSKVPVKVKKIPIAKHLGLAIAAAGQGQNA